MTKSAELELLEGIRATLGDVEFENKKVNFYMGSTKSVVFPYCNIYLGDVGSQDYSRQRWRNLTAFCVVEFTYSADSTSDAKLYDFGEVLIEKISKGILYTRGATKQILTPSEIESSLVEGFYQLRFSLNYSIDTLEKIKQDNTDLMQEITLDIYEKE